MQTFFQNSKRALATILVVGALLFGTPAMAQTELQLAESDRAVLEQQLAQLEAEIAKKETELAGQKGQSVSISRDISILTTQISDAKLKIQAKQLTIKKLSTDINKKQDTIVNLEDKLQKEQESLGQMIRKTAEIDKTPFVYVALGKDSVSEFYKDLDSFATLKRSVKVSLDQIRSVKGQTEAEKKTLEKKQDEAIDTKVELEQQKNLIVKSETEKKQLLNISKSKETVISKYISDTQAKANAIKARLFKLAGGSQAIRFDAALGFAQVASSKTNVDPAFLLAILTQESNLGANVGKCYLTDDATGAGINVSTGATYPNVMKPTRDVQPFLAITGALGFNAYKTVVSCPIKGVAGYGGAMGPAQFIPSTWKLVAGRVASALGKSAASPWDAQDAFMASAVYLSDLGAIGTSYTAQIKAACRYYGTGGTACSYGKSVMKLKASIQADIDYLKQYGISRR